jgi:hypothetical protein
MLQKDNPDINDDIISFVAQQQECAIVKIGQSLAVVGMSDIINMPTIPGLEKNIVGNTLYLKNTSGFPGQLVMALDFNIAIQGKKTLVVVPSGLVQELFKYLLMKLMNFVNQMFLNMNGMHKLVL